MPRPGPRSRDDHWVGAMGIHLVVEGGVRQGRAHVVPEMLAPTTGRLRAGVLATMVDVVGGTPPGGILNPTVDLRVQLWGAVPADGVVRLECRPLRFGRTLYVGDVPLWADGAPEPFGLGSVTFMNRRLDVGDPHGQERRPHLSGTFDDLLGAVHHPDGTSELRARPEISNPHFDTVMGGAQAAFAEVAAEHALATAGLGRFTTDDLLIRYLGRHDDGPLLGRCQWHRGPGPQAAVQVELVTGEDRLVSSVALRGRLLDA